MQNVVVPVLRVLNQKHHQECDGGRRIDDQLPGVVVVKIWPGERPYADQNDSSEKSLELPAQLERAWQKRANFMFKTLNVGVP
jgi:hypothetical protein